MFGQKVKVEGNLLKKVNVAAEMLSCSVEEFVEKTLEREADKVILGSAGNSKKDLSKEQLAELENSLKGLGYLE